MLACTEISLPPIEVTADEWKKAYKGWVTSSDTAIVGPNHVEAVRDDTKILAFEAHFSFALGQHAETAGLLFQDCDVALPRLELPFLCGFLDKPTHAALLLWLLRLDSVQFYYAKFDLYRGLCWFTGIPVEESGETMYRKLDRLARLST